MAHRTTIDIPDALHATLRHRAQNSGSSMRALILRAIENTYAQRGGGDRVQGPLVEAKGKLGPEFPGDENPHDLVFS